MKYFKLLWSGFGQLVHNHFSLLIVLLLGIIISFFSFNTLLGTANYVLEDTTRTFYRTFTLDFGDAIDDSSINKIDELSQSKDVDSVLLMTIRDEAPLLVGLHTKQLEHWVALAEGRDFSESEKQDGALVVIVSDSLYLPADLKWPNHPILIDGKEYQAVGLCGGGAELSLFTDSQLLNRFVSSTNSGSYSEKTDKSDLWDSSPDAVQILPYQTYRQVGYSPNVVRIEITESLFDDLPKIEEELKQFFPAAEVIAPSRPDILISGTLKNTLSQAIFATCLALINIVSLFAYWLWYNRRSYSVYAICGARKGQVLKILLGQWAILVLLGFLLARVLQWILRPVMKTLMISLLLSPLQIILILFGGYLLTLFFLTFSICRCCRIGRGL